MSLPQLKMVTSLPLRGAWIEIGLGLKLRLLQLVQPLAQAHECLVLFEQHSKKEDFDGQGVGGVGSGGLAQAASRIRRWRDKTSLRQQLAGQAVAIRVKVEDIAVLRVAVVEAGCARAWVPKSPQSRSGPVQLQAAAGDCVAVAVGAGGCGSRCKSWGSKDDG